MAFERTVRGIKAQARNWKRTLRGDGRGRRGAGARESESESERVREVGQRANGRPNQFHTPTRRQSLFPIPLATRWFVNGRENARLLINETHYHQAFRDFHRVASCRSCKLMNRIDLNDTRVRQLGVLRLAASCCADDLHFPCTRPACENGGS